MEHRSNVRGLIIRLIVALGLLAPLTATAELPLLPHGERLPILQGATNGDSAQFSILYPESDPPVVTVVAYEDGHTQAAQKPSHLSIDEQKGSQWRAIKAFFNKLSHGRDYYLEVSSSNGNLLDRRKFRLLDTQANKIRLAFVSCSSDEYIAEQGPMWRSLIESRPELLIMLGDNVYVDRPRWTHPRITPAYIWRRYVETRNNLDIYKTAHLIPTLATWDDHDYGKNNTDKDFRFKKESAEIFRSMYAQDPFIPEINHGVGIATYFSAFGQKFFLMDNRTFRTCKWFWCWPQRHWGDEQLTWVLDTIGDSTDPVWLVNGSQFFGAYRTGWSFEGNHSQRFKKVLERLKQLPAPILFASGDIHYSEIMRIEPQRLGYTSYEITSSSIHSRPRSPRGGNFRRIASNKELNFVVADIVPQPGGLDMDVVSLGAHGQEHFRREGLSVRK